MKFITRHGKINVTYVKVGGIDTKVCFSNPLGNGFNLGEFHASDDKLIDALLKDERYDKDWFAANESEAKAFLAKVESVAKSEGKAKKGSKAVSDKGSAELGPKGISGAPGVDGEKETTDTSAKKEDVIGVTEGETEGEANDGSEDSAEKDESSNESGTAETEEIVVHSIPEARKVLKERGCVVGVPSYDRVNEAAEKLGIKFIFKKNGETGDN